jgi:DNA-binding transcriptional ArsR family regulator
VSIYGALAEPNRRAILDLLLQDEQPVGAIVDSLSIGQPTVSKHLKVLREAGLVTMRIDANKRIYRLRPQPLIEVDGWLLPYRRRWAARLDALETFLDASDASDASDAESTPPDQTRQGDPT